MIILIIYVLYFTLLRRINFDVACNMDFRRYPVDVQYCEIKFESFGFQSNQVLIKGIVQPNSPV